MVDLNFQRLMVNVVEIEHPTPTTNRYGDTVMDWASSTKMSTKGWLTQTGTTEDTAGREAIVTEWELSLPADTTLYTYDRVVVDGEPYRIIGNPGLARTPAGPHHLVVQLRTVVG